MSKKRLQVYLSKDLEIFIKTIATRRETSVSSAIESILIEYKAKEEVKENNKKLLSWD